MNYKALVTIIVAAIAFGGVVYKANTKTSNVPIEVVEAFAQWKVSHKREYSSPSEMLYRLGVFYKAFITVRDHNNSKAAYKMALNHFADVTEEEFLIKNTGYGFSTRTKSFNFEQAPNANPPSIDWTTKGAVNAVKNQGQCGSCWAFSATANMEGVNQILNGKLLNLSEQQLVDCSQAYGNYGCNGGLMDNAFKYVKDHGITTTDVYPYKAVDQTCKYDPKTSSGITVTGFTDVPSNNCAALETFVAARPTSVAIAANKIMYYSSGVFQDMSCGTQLNHGVTAVGYGTDNGTPFWKVRNSWGANWGEAGYIRMIKNINTSDAGICGICMDSSSAIIKTA